MNRDMFIKELEKKLKRLPKDELEDVIQYYKEYFEDAGINEDEDVLTKLEPPAVISSQILSEYAFKEFDKNETTGKKGIRTIWFVILAIFAAPIALPLALAAVALILAMILVLVALALAFILITVSLVGGGIFAVVTGLALVSQSISTFIFNLGLGLMFIGLGILMVILLKVIIPKVFVLISIVTKKLLNKFNKKG